MAKSAEQVAAVLWSTMAQAFGERWVNVHGEVPSRLWVQLCQEVGEAGVRRAIDAMWEAGSAHPPSAFEFRRLCAWGRPEEQQDALAYAEALIPTWDRKHASHHDLERLRAARLPRARQVLSGEVEPSERELQVLARIEGRLGTVDQTLRARVEALAAPALRLAHRESE